MGAVRLSAVCGQFHVRSPNSCAQISGHPAKRDGPTGWVCLAGCGGWSKPGQRFERPVKTNSPTGWPDIGGAVVLYWGCQIFFPISFPCFRCFVICHGPLRTDSARPFALGVHVFLPGRWLVRPSFSPAAWFMSWSAWCSLVYICRHARARCGMQTKRAPGVVAVYRHLTQTPTATPGTTTWPELGPRWLTSWPPT